MSSCAGSRGNEEEGGSEMKTEAKVHNALCGSSLKAIGMFCNRERVMVNI